MLCHCITHGKCYFPSIRFISNSNYYILSFSYSHTHATTVCLLSTVFTINVIVMYVKYSHTTHTYLSLTLKKQKMLSRYFKWICDEVNQKWPPLIYSSFIYGFLLQLLFLFFSSRFSLRWSHFPEAWRNICSSQMENRRKQRIRKFE